MTEEEIKKFAKEYVQNNTDESVNSFIGEQLQKAFIEGTDFMYYSNNEELKKELIEKDKQIAELKKIEEEYYDFIQKKNEELDCQRNRNKYCYSCANATERCFKNEIGCPCQKYKSYTEENAELKEKLKPENCLKLLAKEGYIKFSSDNLTKSKEIIKNVIRVTWGEGWNYSLDVKDKAEQFLKESE